MEPIYQLNKNRSTAHVSSRKMGNSHLSEMKSIPSQEREEEKMLAWFRMAGRVPLRLDWRIRWAFGPLVWTRKGQLWRRLSGTGRRTRIWWRVVLKEEVCVRDFWRFGLGSCWRSDSIFGPVTKRYLELLLVASPVRTRNKIQKAINLKVGKARKKKNTESERERESCERDRRGFSSGGFESESEFA